MALLPGFHSKGKREARCGTQKMPCQKYKILDLGVSCQSVSAYRANMRTRVQIPSAHVKIWHSSNPRTGEVASQAGPMSSRSNERRYLKIRWMLTSGLHIHPSSTHAHISHMHTCTHTHHHHHQEQWENRRHTTKKVGSGATAQGGQLTRQTGRHGQREWKQDALLLKHL